ncbi:MAG: DDE-type integrase/transposase/recombinase [Propionivibrio sp.]
MSSTIEDLPPKERAEVKRRMTYIERLRAAGCVSLTPSTMTKMLIAEIAKDMDDQCPPSAISVWRWGKRQQQRGIRAFLSRVYNKNVFRTPTRCREVIENCIDQLFLAGKSGIDTHAEIERLIVRENEQNPKKPIPVPSLATVYRFINSRDAFDRAVAKYGEEEAKRRYRHSKKGICVSRPLERVEIDHTPLDVFVVDEQQQLPLGRPWITVAIDKRTRMVLGFHISFSAPSVESVMRCLRHAVLPKLGLRQRFPALRNDWPCFGLPELLVADNGLEFHAGALEAAAQELSFRLEYGGRKRPFHKGAIERFLKTLNYNLVHKIPGTSFAKYWQRFDCDPLKEALVTFEALVEIIHRWLLDIYAQTPHRGISETPFQRWTREIKMYPAELPAAADVLSVHLSKLVTRRVWHYGIQLHGDQFYQSGELQAMRRRYGENLEVNVRYTGDDLKAIYVRDPETGEYFYVPNADPEEIGALTEEQYLFIRRYRRAMADDQGQRISVAEAKVALREMVSELFSSKKISARSKAARLVGTRSDQQPVPLAHANHDMPPSLSIEENDVCEELGDDLPTFGSFVITPHAVIKTEVSNAVQ